MQKGAQLMAKVNELSGLIERELTAYSKGSTETVKNAVRESASEIKNEISSQAPVGKSGKYAKSWRTKKTAETDTSVTYTVYANKDGYRLAHLLEFGHATRNGGRTSGKPHIKPAEEKGEKDLLEKIRGDLS